MCRRHDSGQRAAAIASRVAMAAVLLGATVTATAQTTADEQGAGVEVTARKAESTAPPTLPEAPRACPIPREHHAWARCEPGAWRRVRIVTETYDEAGELATRSETLQTETLVAVSEDSYTIETENVVSVGGKTLRGVTQRFTRHVLTDGSASPVDIEKLTPVSISVGGQSYSCERWRASVGEGEQHRQIIVAYSPETPPYVLRRELVAADGSSSAEVTNETMRVVRVDMPVLLQDDIVSAQSLRVRTVHGANTTERTEARCDQVPGGLIHASSTERDSSGRRVRWSVEELEEYGRAGPPTNPLRRWRLLHQQRW